LELSSLSDDEQQARNLLEGQLRECYGRVVYTHKTHEKCADVLLDRLSKIQITQIILSALTTGGFISAFFGAGSIGAAIGVVLSTALLILNVYTKESHLGEIAQKHKQAANDIWLIREQYLSLLTDLASGSKTLDAIRQERDALLKALHAVYAGSPSTNYIGYKRAQTALQRDEDMTFSDEEIDAFLPQELKRGSTKNRQSV
jgi:hypothetical protein